MTPSLFSRKLSLLLIGQRKYGLPFAELIRATGAGVDIIDENSFGELIQLHNADQLRKKYDVVWLGAFDSFWKLLDNSEAHGLKTAIHEGVGFIHSGGRGSYHGGFGVSNNATRLSVQLTNGDRYARQIRIRAEWSEPLLLRNLVQYSDNYFDLAPGESRTIEADVFFSKRGSEPIFGRLIVEMPMRLALSVRKPTLGHPSRNLAGRPYNQNLRNGTESRWASLDLLFRLAALALMSLRTTVNKARRCGLKLTLYGSD